MTKKRDNKSQAGSDCIATAKPYDMKPLRGTDTYRVNGSDDLVLIEKAGEPPTVSKQGIILVCTEGTD